MTAQEHTIAIVEPTEDGEATIEFAKRAVDRGDKATLVILVNRKTMQDVAAFAESEELSFRDARALYVERLADDYSTRVAGTTAVTLVADGNQANRVVFETAARRDATSLVVPQHLVNQRNWKSSVAKSQIPVLIAPPRAA